MTARTVAEYDFHKLLFDERYLLSKHFTKGRHSNIKYVTIHHMIILNRDIHSPDALETCRRVWQTRPASAHIGVDGPFVGQFVNDDDTAWGNGNWMSNNETIVIEHANQTLDVTGTQNDYRIDDETWHTGAKVAAAYHKAKNLGEPNLGVTIRKHNDFYATQCPGPYLGGTIWHDYGEAVGNYYEALMRGESLNDVILKTPELKQDVYIVKSGDTLSKIAARFNTTWQELHALNGIANPSLIRVGQEIKLRGTPHKPVVNVVDEVIAGQWGNNPERARRLSEAGYNPIAVQNEVNRRLGG